MLTGQNGIMNNARSANVHNIYYNAEEQVKLAYMAVKTEIMIQKTIDSKYEANTKENTIKLGNIVLKNLVGKSLEFATDATGKNLVKGDSHYTIDVKLEGVILITYINNVIVAGEISENKPAQSGKLVYKIILQKQDATLKTDTGYSKDVEEKLAVSTSAHKTPWVKFANNDQLYRVLYDANSPYGIEIITSNALGNVSIGSNDSTGEGTEEAGNIGSSKRAIWSYNNSIDTLNKAAENSVIINNELVENVRSVGSQPNNKDNRNNVKYDKSISETTTNFSNIHDGKLEMGEEVLDTTMGKTIYRKENYKADWEQMQNLNIKVTDRNYWLASRYFYFNSGWLYFNIRSTDFSRTTVVMLSDVFLGQSNGNSRIYTHSLAVRPVLHLTPKIKITGGDGLSEETAYIIE